MIFIGDVHGKWDDLAAVLARHPHDHCIQVGDMGLGFGRPDEPSILHDRFKFIRGNHDDPAVCRAHPNYMGDYGRNAWQMWVGGAWSIDQWHRTEGVSWWRDEELDAYQLNCAVQMAIENRPRIVFTHDCPETIFNAMRPEGVHYKTRTGQALQAIWDAWRPQYWIFGHHHNSWRQTVDGCVCVCLNELETLELSD